AAWAACSASMAESAPALSATPTAVSPGRAAKAASSACSSAGSSAGRQGSGAAPDAAGNRRLPERGVRSAGFLESPIGRDAFEAAAQQLVHIQAGEFAQCVGQGALKLAGHGGRVAVG